MCLTQTLCLVSKWKKLLNGLTTLTLRQQSHAAAKMDLSRRHAEAEVPAVKLFAAKVNLLIWPFSLNHNFSFSVTRFHLAFDEFDKTQCSADLFYRNTDIWKLNDVCPKPKTWVPYEPPYSKYQSLPTYVRGKRQTEGNQAECDSTRTTETGCSSFGASLDVQTCKSSNLYSPEKIVEGRNPTCCLQPNFRDNSIAQGGGGDEGTANFRATKKECCDQYRAQTGGVDALNTLRCNYSS